MTIQPSCWIALKILWDDIMVGSSARIFLSSTGTPNLCRRTAKKKHHQTIENASDKSCQLYLKHLSGMFRAMCHIEMFSSTDHVRKGPNKNAIVPYACQKNMANTISIVIIITNGACSVQNENFPRLFSVVVRRPT